MFDGEYPEIDPLQLKSQKPVEFSAKNCWPAIPRIPAILMFARGTRFWPIPDTCPNMARHWLDKRTAGKLLRLVCHAQRFLGARVPMAVTWHTPNAPRQALNFWDGPCLDNLPKKNNVWLWISIVHIEINLFWVCPIFRHTTYGSFILLSETFHSIQGVDQTSNFSYLEVTRNQSTKRGLTNQA